MFDNHLLSEYIYATFCAMHIAQRIANIIKNRRLELSLSQQDVSEMSQVALRTVNALESGNASVNLKNLVAIADVLGLEISLELKKLGGKGETGV